jgi:phage-related minor tail protein
MKMKLVIAAAALLAAMPAFGQGQPPKPAKPSKADVQKVLVSIASDPAKVTTYCQLNKINQQMAQVDQKDQKKMEQLGTQADGLMQKLGPDYNRVMDGLDAVDENSAEGKEYAALFAPLDSKCK